MKIVVFPEHLEQLSPHPHHSDYNCTKMNHAVPMSQDTPNRNHVCSFDSYIPRKANQSNLVHFNEAKFKRNLFIPYDYIRHLFQ